MPAQTFRSPNFFDREIDQSGPAPQGPVGVPAGVVGTANRGPAFVPVTVGNFDQFISVFGNLDPKRFGPYAAFHFLANRSSLTFMRILGGGANVSSADITRTQVTGRVKNAGFHLDGQQPAAAGDNRYDGTVQFLVAEHTLQPDEAFGAAIFTDNDSFHGTTVRLVRGMVMTPETARVMVTDGNHDLSTPGQVNGLIDFGDMTGTPASFKLVISSSLGSAFFNDDGNPGCHILTASFNPDDKNYFAKLLNNNPDNFVSAQHLLYADFAVDDQVATATVAGVLSGTVNVSLTSGDPTLLYRKAFGAFDTRFRTPATTFFISQPFGTTEYDLFAVEALDDGQFANNLYKVSVVNVQASTNPANPYGTFSLQVRQWTDTDVNPVVLEQFNNLSLNPNAANYIAAVIGDRKVTYNFDTTLAEERRVITAGKYPNQSTTVRVVMNDLVNRGLVPATSLPFGFRGAKVLKTNDTLTDDGLNVGTIVRLNGIVTGSGFGQQALSGSILPPVPLRSKVTKGQRPAPSLWLGQPGPSELSSPLYYWGVQFERLDIPLDPNIESLPNNLLSAYTQFLGIELLDVLVTGSGADQLNNNKFSLSKVAFSNTALADLTASIDTHMREAAYLRNGKVDGSQYTINDGVLGNRVTFGTLLGKGTAAQFNRFGPYLKFTSFMMGGWDGVNMLDPDARRMNDKATSFDAGGEAAPSFVSPGMLTLNQGGAGQNNSAVQSYLTAINVMTDPLQVNHNVLAIPGIREPFVTDYAGLQVRSYGLAYYVMDIQKFDELSNRLFDDSTTRPDVDKTAQGLDTRGVDNNYVGTYFPDVIIQDQTNNRRVKVPVSVAALGALAFNDRVGYPWFAPAGFNRAALDFVTNVEVRLNSSDRDTLYDARINPVATFPRQGFVIFGQKTLQQAKSALDRVNVRRLLLEVKRVIVAIANKLEFEQNTPEVWNKFVSQAVLQLGLIQAQAGIEAFQVIMNETNNSPASIDQNKLNGRVVIVPTRVVEFISLDFIITQSGVQFV
jgi:hypothetical protein